MEDKNTGIQFLYHFRMFKTRVLGEYMIFWSVIWILDLQCPVPKEGKRLKFSEHGSSDSYSRVGRIAAWRSLTTGCLEQSAYTWFLTFRELKLGKINST